MLHSVTDSCVSVSFFFFFKQKTAYEMRISDGSSDVCSSDLRDDRRAFRRTEGSAEPAHPGGPDGRGQRYRRGCRLSGVEGSRLCHRPDHPCERRDGDAELTFPSPLRTQGSLSASGLRLRRGDAILKNSPSP